MIIEQYRPPIDKFIIGEPAFNIFEKHCEVLPSICLLELPAGLIDKGETAEQAAIRELEEETGFKADRVVQSSPIIVSDPGVFRSLYIKLEANQHYSLGMTTANMKLVIVSVLLEDNMEVPDAKLDPGEFIVTRVVELAALNSELRCMYFFLQFALGIVVLIALWFKLMTKRCEAIVRAFRCFLDSLHTL